jgi:LPXTG-motif cell wall-anchored protein
MNEPVTIDVLANDSDPLGGDLTIVDVEDPDNAEVTINEDGTITVTPDEDFTGTIVFEYTVINEEERAATATVTITVVAPEPTPTPTLPTIEVTETTIPLAEPTPTLPTIEVTEESVPLAEPTVPTIEVVQEEIPKSGENAPLWPIGLALLTLAGGLTLILRRRSSDDTVEQDD